MRAKKGQQKQVTAFVARTIENLGLLDAVLTCQISIPGSLAQGYAWSYREESTLTGRLMTNLVPRPI